MRFNDHSALDGKHAFLSPSSYHWLRYSEDKLFERYDTMTAQQRGTLYHAYAAESIRLGVKLRGTATLAQYVNDAIGFRMTPEQPLYYSEYCFGTADAISFRKNELRIHDLKTGVTPASMDQLIIYAALFCLEYEFKPGDIFTELRIYQNNEVVVFQPEADDIVPVMDRIVYFSKLLQERGAYED